MMYMKKNCNIYNGSCVENQGQSHRHSAVKATDNYSAVVLRLLSINGSVVFINH